MHELRYRILFQPGVALQLQNSQRRGVRETGRQRCSPATVLRVDHVRALLRSDIMLIALERYSAIVMPMNPRRQEFLTGKIPHVIILMASLIFATLCCFVPAIGRVAMQPSGQYANADFFRASTCAFTLVIVMTPAPLSAYFFFKIYQKVQKTFANSGVESSADPRR